VTIKAKAEWLMCADVCVPGEADLQIQLPVETGIPAAGAEASKIARVPMPVEPVGWKIDAKNVGMESLLTIHSPEALNSPHFFSEDGFIAHDAAQELKADRDGIVLTLRIADPAAPLPDKLLGVLAYSDEQGNYRGVRIDAAFATDLPVSVPAVPGTSSAPQGAASGLIATLGLAFVGGLILNLMPCVFPVLGIKILGFVNQSGNNRRLIKLHGLVFSAGVLVSFWTLAAILAVLRAGGDELGWGFQLQSPGFIFTLAVIMLVFALSLSGVFEFGMSATGLGSGLQMRSGYTGSFFTGVLATVVATPCSAPFLAPALGAALALPVGEGFVVFTAIAIGLALPYLLLSIFPQAVRMLPRPGAWMETFKQFMAFPLYATVGYLLWVLAGQTQETGLLMAFFALTLIAMAAWCYGRFAAPGATKARSRLGALAGVALLATGFWTGWPQAPTPTDIVWSEWSPEAVDRAISDGKSAYLDFTARWCATCQANKKLVFTNAEVKRLFHTQGVVAFKADWTNKDPRITAELAKWGRSAVPFNLVIQPGHPPQPLPELLTPGIVLKAFEKP